MRTLHRYLPGTLTLGRGTREDYLALERFHYLARRPATFAEVVVARFDGVRPAARGAGEERGRVVGVGVLSWPVAHALGRDVRFGLGRRPMREKLLVANRDFRTISRVIVHPQFRGIGLAVDLIRWLIEHCPTRYVDAMARMGRAHPMFERAGMTRVRTPGDGPFYYVFDRTAPDAAARRVSTD